MSTCLKNILAEKVRIPVQCPEEEGHNPDAGEDAVPHLQVVRY